MGRHVYNMRIMRNGSHVTGDPRIKMVLDDSGIGTIDFLTNGEKIEAELETVSGQSADITAALALIAAIPVTDQDDSETIWNDEGVLKVSSAP